MRKYCSGLVLLVTLGLVGCHTCDVCDDCGDVDGQYNMYAPVGCSHCNGGGSDYPIIADPGYGARTPVASPVVKSGPVVTARPAAPKR